MSQSSLATELPYLFHAAVFHISLARGIVCSAGVYTVGVRDRSMNAMILREGQEGQEVLTPS